MTRIICVLVCVHIFSNSYAQKIKENQLFTSNGMIDFQIGAAIPVLNFGLAKLTLPAGYAKLGYTLKLGMNYDVANFVGLAFQYQYANNAFNSENVLQDLQASNSIQTYHNFSSNAWELKGTVLGLYYPFRSYKTSIDIRLMGGYFSGIYPESEINFTDPLNNNMRLNIKTIETSASNFGFQVGVKMRYQLYKKIMLSAGFDYTQTTIEFSNIRAIETNYNIPVKAKPYTQQFQLINLMVGIGMCFD